MNLNDPTFLRSASAFIQWMAIALAAVAVGLQTLKHFVDLRERRISTQVAAKKDEDQQARERALHEKLEMSQRRIRSLELELQYDMTAKWKGGKSPNPGEFISMGGGGSAIKMTFVPKSGKAVDVEFFGEHQITFLPIEDGATRISYRTVASPRSNIYGLTCDEIEAIRDVQFVCVGANSDSLDDPIFSLANVKATFFANGQRAFEVTLTAHATTAPQGKIGSGDFRLRILKDLLITHFPNAQAGDQ